MYSLSIVIPLFNEIESVERLLERIDSAMTASPFPWELVLVDDGSTDGTTESTEKLIEKYGKHQHLLQLQRNYGKATALQAGIDYASGDIIITMDADLQDNPEEIPAMVQMIQEDQYDMVSGWKKNSFQWFQVIEC